MSPSAIESILGAGRLLLARHAEAGVVPADVLRVFLAELEAALRLPCESPTSDAPPNPHRRPHHHERRLP